MPFAAWKQKERNRDRKMYLLITMTSGGLVIAVRKNSFIDSK